MGAGDTREEIRNRIRFLLEVEGELAPGVGRWLEAERITAREGSTLLEVRVRDQAELYGRLRRIHDLHLKLLSLKQVSPGEGEG